MKKYFISASVVFLVLTFNLVISQPAQATLCCQSSAGCGSVEGTTCSPGFTKVDCASAGCPGTTSGSGTSGEGTTTSSGATFVNPIKFTTVSAVVNALMTNLRGILVSVAVLFIVIGAIMYILSAGDEKKMTTAKGTITAAMIGLAIALAAPSFLSEIITILGGKKDGLDTTTISGAITLRAIILNTLNFLLSVVGILSLIGMVVGGSFYLTAYGDDKKAENGKKIITASVIGIVVALGALTIVTQIAKFFK